ncbi:MAG TPA: hypothetical protein VFD58_09890 [Blastocatellia bacterium]|nr:hypothetical protein [Blastocatellia bacterium]
MKSHALKLIVICLVVIASAATNSSSVHAQQRPLITEDVDIIKPGAVRVDFGFDFVQSRDFPLSGLNGDLTRIGVVNLRAGLAPNVEFEAGGVIQNFLSINRQYQPSATPLRLSKAPVSTSDTGDFFLATKIKLRNEGRRIPSLGFRFGVQLPNSNQERGIGVNQINFFATAIAGKHFGRVNLFGNLGLGILTAPVDLFTQNDVVLYGLAATYKASDRLTLVGEVNGRQNTRSNAPRGTESDGEARIGARLRAAGLVWDVAGIRGLNRHSARSGVTFGVSYETDLFTPAK